MGLAAIPTSAGVYAAMQFSPKFVKVSMVLKATICLVYKILSLSSLNQHPTLQITP